MSRIEELIKEKCPDGVEYCKLEDVLKYEQPTKYIVSNTEYDISNPIPVLTAGQSFILGYTDEIDGVYKASKEKPVIIFDDFTTSFHWVDFEFKVKSSAMKMLRPRDWNKYNFRYLYYAMCTIEYVPVEHSRQWISNYSQFEIPVPPIEVQQEIVRILDKFTELEAGLQDELEARKKQYEYYENKLLYENKHGMVKLGELCVVNQGLQIPISERKKEKGENCYFYITVQFLKQNGDVFYVENPSESVICHEDDILVTRTGSTGVIITGVEGCFHNNFFKVNCNKNIFNKYMYYVLKSGAMYRRMLTAASGGSVPDLPHKKFYELDIPLPAMEEQKDIVKKLEIFEKICNDEQDGLLAEIAARHKQYEYYRDKLLTFERKVV